jgi:Concanavalin A-like lectin/glucanases superfamily
MKTNIRVIICLLLVAAGTAVGQQKSTVEMLQQAYQAKEQALLVQYGKGLDTNLDDLKKKGDLDNFLKVENEKKRFEKTKTVLPPSSANLPLRPVVLAYYRATTTLQEQYLKALDEQIKKEVIAGRIEAAKVLKAEKDKITLLLAENQALVPAEAVPEKTKSCATQPKKLHETLTQDLLLHFTFSGQGKTEVTDESGKGSEGVMNGCVQTLRGSKGVLKFDGKNDYLVTRDNLDLRGVSPWTMSVWFKASKQPKPYDNIISIGKENSNRGVYGIGAGNDVYSLNINLWSQFNYSIKTGIDCSKVFMHVAATFDGGSMRIYVNGVKKDDTQLNLWLKESPVYIGGRTGGYEGQYFDGIIGETMIFKRALTAAEVESLYTSQK